MALIATPKTLPGGVFKSLAIIGVFIFALYGRTWLFPISLWSDFELVERLIIYYAWWIIPTALTTGLLFEFKYLFNYLGVNRSIFVALTLSIVAVAPMFIAYAILSSFQSELSLLAILRSTLFAGFFEEYLFRGFLFGLLFRKCGWGFIPAAGLGALIFGSMHLFQSEALLEALGIFMVTFMGGAWFAWLYIEWENNLWLPIFLHTFMNLAWTLFDISDNALGGFIPNIFRALTILITVILTLKHRQKMGHFSINGTNLWRS